jgi:hypothetical protein
VIPAQEFIFCEKMLLKHFANETQSHKAIGVFYMVDIIQGIREDTKLNLVKYIRINGV